MTLQFSTRRTGARSLRDRANALAVKLGGVVSGWNDRRDVRARLSRVSARELADIGLDRRDLDRIVG